MPSSALSVLTGPWTRGQVHAKFGTVIAYACEHYLKTNKAADHRWKAWYQRARLVRDQVIEAWTKERPGGVSDSSSTRPPSMPWSMLFELKI
jgi:hypothetical protein